MQHNSDKNIYKETTPKRGPGMPWGAVLMSSNMQERVLLVIKCILTFHDLLHLHLKGLDGSGGVIPG